MNSRQKITQLFSHELAMVGSILGGLALLSYGLMELGPWISRGPVSRAQRVNGFYLAEIAALHGFAQGNGTTASGWNSSKPVSLPVFPDYTIDAFKTASVFSRGSYKHGEPLMLSATRQIFPKAALRSPDVRLSFTSETEKDYCGKATFNSGNRVSVCLSKNGRSDTMLSQLETLRTIPLSKNEHKRNLASGPGNFTLPPALTCFYAYSLKDHDRFGIFSDAEGNSVVGTYREHSTQCDNGKTPTQSLVERTGRASTSFVVNGGTYRLGESIPVTSPSTPLLAQLRLDYWDEAHPDRPIETFLSNGKVDLRKFFDGHSGTLTEIGAPGTRLLGIKNCLPMQRPPSFHLKHVAEAERLYNPYGAFDRWSFCEKCDCRKSANRIGKKWQCNAPEQLCRK